MKNLKKFYNKVKQDMKASNNQLWLTVAMVLPFFLIIQILDEVPSVTFPFFIKIASYALFFFALFAAIIFGSKFTVLMSLLDHRKSS